MNRMKKVLALVLVLALLLALAACSKEDKKGDSGKTTTTQKPTTTTTTTTTTGDELLPEEVLKILQARLQQYVNRQLPDVQAGFRKDRGTRAFFYF